MLAASPASRSDLPELGALRRKSRRREPFAALFALLFSCEAVLVSLALVVSALARPSDLFPTPRFARRRRRRAFAPASPARAFAC